MSHRSNSPVTNDPSFKLFGSQISSQESDTHLQTPSSTATSAASMACSVEDSDNFRETPMSEGPETVSPAEHDSNAVHANPHPGTGVVLKKPDKILPCPRCNSMETKFCYFNNYNVNQPRHFCRSCQRYWTAGGSVRNLPVGAGRRKSKHVSSKLQSILKSSEVYSSLVNLANGADQSSPTRTTLCMSLENRLTLEEHENHVEVPTVSYGERTGDTSSSCSSLREAEVSHKGVDVRQVGSPAGPPTSIHSFQGFPVPLPYPYLWNFGLSGMSPGSGTSNAFLLPGSPPTVPMINSFYLPNMAYPVVPSFGWSWGAGNEKIPSGHSLSPSSSAGNSSFSASNPSPLGKHSRDLESRDEVEKSLWIPKTLRIDDPEEAAKSSIWSTLGITPGTNEPVSKGGIFKAFQSRAEKFETSEAGKALGANPAALSRSQRFHENT